MSISSSAGKPKRMAATASEESAIASPITLCERSSTGLALLRILVGYLWFQQLFWKLPPFSFSFGQFLASFPLAVLFGVLIGAISIQWQGHYGSRQPS